jgi:hypothetical protein
MNQPNNMKKLNETSTKIFCQLLDKLGVQEHRQIRINNYMPLTIELIGSNIETPYGNAKWYSLSHHFEQNGDLMRDPEMCFLVVDHRIEPNDFVLVGIYPQMYQQDSLGIYEESVKLDTSGVQHYLPKWQQAHCQFANGWLKNIRAQGFLK